MKKLLVLSITLIMCLYMGCAPRDHLSRDDLPTWDSSIPSDYVPKETAPLEIEKIPELLSEGESSYNFRKTRWGFSPERVKLSEKGIRPDESTRELLVYRIPINGIKCKLIYTFKDNKLRTAGYITIEPVRNAESLIQKVLDEYNMPMPELEHGMVWKGDDSIVWTNSYTTVIKETLTKYRYSDGGMLGDLLYKEFSEREKAGEIAYFDGVIGYVNKKFYDELHKEARRSESPLDFVLFRLSHYEKQLMGIIEKSGRTIIPGIGEIRN